MTPTQQERRIQALYDDANVSRRYLCERVVHLEADMEELRCKLSSTFDGRERMFRANVEKNRDLMRLMEENAKLREYAKLMHGHIKKCCDACGERDICDVDALTRSLGIEMPE